MIRPLLIILGFFAFYLPRVSPTLYGGDTGEFMVGGHVLGIPHAPGYPLLVLLLKCGQILIPLGNVAYRSNVVSCLLAAGTLVLVWVLVGLVQSDKSTSLPKWVGVFLLGLAPLYIEQALVVEAFVLNLAFVVAILSTLYKNQIILSWFLFGLGMGNHHTLVFVLPFLITFSLKQSLSLKGILTHVAFASVGLSIYFFLLIRAQSNPPINFGNPDTLAGLWNLFTRKEFGSLSLHPAAVPFMDGSLFLEQAGAFLQRMISKFGLVACLIGCAGFVFSLISPPHRKKGVVCLAIIVVCGFGFDLVSNLSPTSAIGQWRMERFVLFPILFFVFLGVLGTMAQPKIPMAVLVIILISRGVSFGTAPSFRDNFIYHDFATSTFRSVPKGASFIIDRELFDEPTSSFLVANQLFHKRTDIDFYYRPGTLFGSQYGTDILNLTWPDRLKRQKEIETNLLGKQKPFSFFAFEKRNAPFKNPQLNGLVYQPPQQEKVLIQDSLIIQRPTNADPSYPERLMSIHFPYFKAKGLFEQGNIEEGEKVLRHAMKWGRDMAWFHTNIAGMYADANQIKKAEAAYKKSIQVDPYFSHGYFGLGFTAMKRNGYNDAQYAYSLAAKLEPTNPSLHYMLGYASYELGDKEQAQSAWERFLELDPRGPRSQSIREAMKELH